jgi:redox-sensitive bicupin YhaK (pirin superfamily)
VSLYAGILSAGDTIEHALQPNRCAWLHAARGSIQLNGENLGSGDGAAILGESRLDLAGIDNAEVILWDLPIV